MLTYIRLNHNIKTDETKDLVELWGIYQLLQSLISLNFFFTLVFVTIFCIDFMKTSPFEIKRF